MEKYGYFGLDKYVYGMSHKSAKSVLVIILLSLLIGLGITKYPAGLEVVQEAEDQEYEKSATFFSLVRNSDLYGILKSIASVEDRFNSRHHYDWVFANDKPFDEKFVKLVSSMCSGETHFVLIPEEMWSYPDHIDQNKAAEVREEMSRKMIKYGSSESYRHMCRFNSGFFFRLPIMQNYKYYWRVEPDIEYRCDILYDPFEFMRENRKVYGFNLAPLELHTTVETLWETVRNYTIEHPLNVARDNNMMFLTDDDGESFNMCHFWSNFEIGDLDFFRSPQYTHFFEYLDLKGGIYYERWGDAPIHTMAVSLLLNKDQLQFFPNTGYYHNPNGDCPRSLDIRIQNNCDCQPLTDFTWDSGSCITKFFDIHSYQRPLLAPKRKYRPIHKSAAKEQQTPKADEIPAVPDEVEEPNNNVGVESSSEGSMMQQHEKGDESQEKGEKSEEMIDKQNGQNSANGEVKENGENKENEGKENGGNNANEENTEEKEEN